MESGPIAPRRSGTRLVIMSAGAAFLASLIGVFVGLYGWDRYGRYEAAQSAAEAASAAEAESLTPRGQQRAVVLRYLNDPSSAQFQNEYPAPREKHAWCGEVNARNRMGGMVGFRRYAVALDPDPDMRGIGLDRLYIDPSQDDSASLQQRQFETAYAGYCGS